MHSVAGELYVTPSLYNILIEYEVIVVPPL